LEAERAGQLGGLDAAILLAFAIYAVSSGLRARRTASTGLAEYFLAGRSLPGWKAGISMAATQFAADTPLLVTGLIATAGIFSLWRLWIYALAFLLLGFVLAPSWRRAGVLTDAELAEVRYGGAGAAWLRGVKAVYFGLVFNCAVLAMVLWAAKEIAEPFLRWHQWLPQGFVFGVRALVEWLGVPFARASASEVDVWLR
jgi:Na+/proline symporter